ncbi:hypothetical protein RRG08_002232 [Elysia crispata]|uniref:Major facilitator superfamily (MFS) profile domain-containing protein n=1 Tax=Elysia crispata TaxID=231223 RepID=A0AAE1DCU0_9GAST|nr:hypothetical protein RRG08_002232 [Elysia crispata]
MDKSGYIKDCKREGTRNDTTVIDGKKTVGFQEMESKTWTSDKPPPLLGSSRLALSLIACVGFLNLYALRVNLSVAMVCMVNQTALDLIKDAENGGSGETNQRPATCNGVEKESSNDTTSGDREGEFVWSKEIQGYVLGSFFWGYLLTQVLGGWLAARYGGKRVYGYFMLMCAIVTLLMPVSARTDYKLLMVMRLIAGICQGVVWPSMAVLWTKWAPSLESGKLTGICYAGSQIGNVVTFPIASLLCEYGFDGGWPSVFYVLGTFGLIWFIGWMIIVADSPEQHPRISNAEREYICENRKNNHAAEKEKPKTPTPWFAILTSRRVWAIIVTHTCANWGTYTFLTNIPSYMKEVLYFDLKKNGLLSALPYIGFGAAISISGMLFDLEVSRGLLNKTTARKLGNTLGLLVPGIFVVGLAFVDCTQSTLAVALLVIGVAMSGFQYGAGFLTNPAELAPHYAGIIFGISNTFATLPGIFAPMMIGYITTDQTQEQWQKVFFIAAAIYTFGALFFIIFGSAEIQPWDQTALEVEVKVSVENSSNEKNTLQKAEKNEN